MPARPPPCSFDRLDLAQQLGVLGRRILPPCLPSQSTPTHQPQRPASTSAVWRARASAQGPASLLMARPRGGWKAGELSPRLKCVCSCAQSTNGVSRGRTPGRDLALGVVVKASVPEREVFHHDRAWGPAGSAPAAGIASAASDSNPSPRHARARALQGRAGGRGAHPS